MIEKSNSSFQRYQKKIIPYLDGSLSSDEHSEFEAFVRTHPEFEPQIKSKMDELAILRTMIPTPLISKASFENIESEIRLSVYNLLKSEPKNFWDELRIKFDDWLSR